MKTLKTILIAVSFLLMLPFTTQAQEDESFLLNTTAFTVKFGHDANFTDGVKKWNKCYKDNKGTETWNVWHRIQGEGNVYVLGSRMKNWAAMDDSDPAGKACAAIAITSIIPHIESSAQGISRSIPKLSRKASYEGTSVIWVTSFKVNNGMLFNEIADEVTSTIATKEGDKRGYWYRVMGGKGASHFVTTPYKSFAEMDIERDGVWEAYESIKGKAKTKEMREKFNTTFDDVWSYIYTLEEELSMN